MGATDFFYNKYAGGRRDPALIAELNANWSGPATTLTPAATLAAPLQEQPWNVGFGLNILSGAAGYTIAGTGGGASSCVEGGSVDPITGAYGTCAAGYPKPSWQTGNGVPSDGVRDIPDVSLFGASGTNLSFWPICANVYDCLESTQVPGSSITVTTVGGTSSATPAMAGIMALVNQSQHGRQGNVNSRLYAIAAQHPTAFNDVRVGNNNVPCVNPSTDCSLDTNGDGFYSLQHYSTGIGYDQASGLGSINGGELLANWDAGSTDSPATWTSLTLSEITFEHGTPINADSTVRAGNGKPNGLVALLTDVPGQTGQGVIPIVNGKGSAALASLPGGHYTIVGSYDSGNGSFRPSTSLPVNVNVSPEPSTAVLTGTMIDNNYVQSTLTDGETVSYGSTYYLDGTIGGKSGHGAATGAVVYRDGKEKIGAPNLSEGSLTELAYGQLSPGMHQLSVQYAGDSSFGPSSSKAFSLNVIKGTPYVYFTSFNGSFGPPVSAGQLFPLSLNVSTGPYAAAPSGTVTITVGNLPSQTVKLQPSFTGVPSGIVTAYFTPPTAGSYPVSVTYNGDSNYTITGLTYPTSLTVKAPSLPSTKTVLTSNTATAGPDSTVKLFATVVGSIPNVVPTGTVTFVFSYGLGDQIALDSTGKATAWVGGDGFPTGPTIVSAVYSGDKNYSSSSSNPVTIQGNQGDFSITSSNSNLTLTAGALKETKFSLQSVISNSVLGGLSGQASLSCKTSSPALGCLVVPGSVFVSGNGKPSSAQVIIWAGDRELMQAGSGDTPGYESRPKTPAGTYQVTVLGNLLGVQHSMVLRVTVDDTPK